MATDPTTRLREAVDAEKAATAERETALAEALRAGVPQKDVVAITGYSRETVRRMARAAGIDPAK